MKSSNLDFIELGLLLSLDVILVVLIYVLLEGDLSRLLAEFV